MIPVPALPLREAVIHLALAVVGGLMLMGAVLCWLTPDDCSLLTGLCS